MAILPGWHKLGGGVKGGIVFVPGCIIVGQQWGGPRWYICQEAFTKTHRCMSLGAKCVKAAGESSAAEQVCSALVSLNSPCMLGLAFSMWALSLASLGNKLGNSAILKWIFSKPDWLQMHLKPIECAKLELLFFPDAPMFAIGDRMVLS